MSPSGDVLRMRRERQRAYRLRLHWAARDYRIRNPPPRRSPVVYGSTDSTWQPFPFFQGRRFYRRDRHAVVQRAAFERAAVVLRRAMQRRYAARFPPRLRRGRYRLRGFDLYD